MSLKAKLEAVIYAAEEPVTLNQLALLFSDEALEWRAEQQNAAAQAEASKRASAAGPLPMLARTFDYPIDVDQDALAPTQIESSAETVTPDEPSAEAPAEPAETAAQSQSEPADQTAQQPAAEESGDETQPPAESSETSPEASPEPTPEELARQAARQRDREARLAIRELLDELVDDYANDGSGIEIREIAGGFRMGTKPEYHDAVRAFVKSLKPAMKLSLPALETLAVIAYKQPVTAPEVNEIRGVDSSGVFGSLLARKLIATSGRKQVVGRPILYKTTKEFLLRFGLKDVSELPSMEEFEKMAASEFEETEAAEAEGESPAADAESETEAADAENETPSEEATEPQSPAENPDEPETANAASEPPETTPDQPAEKLD